MHQLAKDEQFFHERGFGKQLGIGEKPCLLVVDFILGFTRPDMPMGSDLTPQLVKTNQLIQEFRKLNLPVIFTSISYDDEESFSDSGLWAIKMEGLKTLKASTDAVKVDPSLDYQKGDGLIYKKYASAFFGTDLFSRLTAGRVDTVIVTGCTTSGCVRATVVDALQYGFRPIVVEDAVGDRSAATHTQSLFDMRQKYADVLDCVETLSALRKFSANLAN